MLFEIKKENEMRRIFLAMILLIVVFSLPAYAQQGVSKEDIKEVVTRIKCQTSKNTVSYSENFSKSAWEAEFTNEDESRRYILRWSNGQNMENLLSIWVSLNGKESKTSVITLADYGADGLIDSGTMSPQKRNRFRNKSNWQKQYKDVINAALRYIPECNK